MSEILEKIGSEAYERRESEGGMVAGKAKKPERRGRPKLESGTEVFYFRTRPEFAQEIRDAAEAAGQTLVIFLERTLRKGMNVKDPK